MRARRNLVLVLATVTAVALGTAGGAVTPAGAAQHTGPRPGAPGAGDPYFPAQGNGGYDVARYNITIHYSPRTGMLRGSELVVMRATQDLSRFDLDLRRSLHVTRVTVRGGAAAYRRAGTEELQITPGEAIPDGHRVLVLVDWHGKAHATHDPDGSLDGFIHTDDGAFVASEPQGSPTWFPVNDTPDDKARYAVTIVVPNGYQAISNGRLDLVRHENGHTEWYWKLIKPVSSYLVTASIGHFRITRGRTPGGVPFLEAVDPQEQPAMHGVLRHLPAIVDFFARKYGPYPFGTVGAIVDHAHRAGYALETATRPLFDRAPSEATLAHELAHQWYGDTVTLHHWRDIWLNEGFAQFSQWLWVEHSGGISAAGHLHNLMHNQPASEHDYWSPPPGNPRRAKDIFADSVYVRGAATLEALREKVGDRTFFRIMRGWLKAHEYGNARVGQFTAYAASVSGRDLTPFFRNWLYRPGKPRGRG